jgi:AcrR family transcriptional regulator
VCGLQRDLRPWRADRHEVEGSVAIGENAAMASPPAPRRRLTAEARRAEILEAALAVFSAHGYHPSSIDEIAQAAGVSKALIYEHFDSKMELHVSLIEMHAGELFERVAAAAAPGPDAAERLEAGLDAVFTFVEERRGAWRMLFREAADPETAAVLDRVTAGVAGLVADLIAQDPDVRARAVDRARREEGIEMVAQMIVGSAQSLANWWADHQDVPRQRLVQVAMELLWMGLDRLRVGENLPEGAR